MHEGNCNCFEFIVMTSTLRWRYWWIAHDNVIREEKPLKNAKWTAETSGVTRVGVTRGGNWRWHHNFFPQKLYDLFLVITVCQFCSVTPHLFLPVRPRLSTILCKFAHKNFFFIRESPPPLEGVTRGSPPPPSNATGRNRRNSRESKNRSSSDCSESTYM